MFKKITINRAEDIISSANKNFKKFYKANDFEIIFWISENPYRKYLISLDRLPCEIKIRVLNDLIDLLEKNNFKNIKEENV